MFNWTGKKWWVATLMDSGNLSAYGLKVNFSRCLDNKTDVIFHPISACTWLWNTQNSWAASLLFSLPWSNSTADRCMWFASYLYILVSAMSYILYAVVSFLVSLSRALGSLLGLPAVGLISQHGFPWAAIITAFARSLIVSVKKQLTTSSANFKSAIFVTSIRL